MAGRNLTIRLTDDQQKQIKDATGKNLTELSIDLASTGHLTEMELEGVAGGKAGEKPLEFLKIKLTD